MANPEHVKIIKQGAAVTVPIGPYVDAADGATPLTDLTIAQADVLLSKSGGAMAAKHSVTGCTHDQRGWYGCPLDTTDTDTPGPLLVDAQMDSALPVWHELAVMAAQAFESLFGADLLQVDIREASGTAVNSPDDLKANVEDLATEDTAVAAEAAASAAAVAATAANGKLPADTATKLGRLDVAVSTRASQTTADAIKAKTDQLGTAYVTYTCPARSSGAFVLYGGNDYLTADGPGRAFAATITDYSGPDLAGATAVVRFLAAGAYDEEATTAAALEVAATLSVNGTTVIVSADLTAVQTAALSPAPPAEQRNYVHQFNAILASGSVVNLPDGRTTVRKGIAEAS